LGAFGLHGVRREADGMRPLFSWLLARGRCRHCGHALGLFYPAIELAALAVAAIAIAVDGSEQAWLDCLFGWWLLALAWIDLRHLQLPDMLTLPLLVVGLIAAAAFDAEGLADRAAAAALGYVALRAVAEVYRRLRRREGLGQGDAKLFAASGAWLGAEALPVVLLWACASAIVAILIASWPWRDMPSTTRIPFGPFLGFGTWLVWLYRTP
jgi:leader peptidase (prepilin peptidase)/N-methyltransferase